MPQKAFVVTGLGYGDEGKGTVTDWLSSLHNAHTVIRFGGPQALHRVVSNAGGEHVFSQFGSGSLHGSATHLSRNMMIDPNAILTEGDVLKYEQGIGSIFSTLTIHKEALVITPFQAMAGRLRELMRGPNRRGSVGIGVGETAMDALRFPETAIRAKDLTGSDLRTKLELVRDRKLEEFEALRDRASVIPEDVREGVRAHIAYLEDPETVAWMLERCRELVRKIRIVNTAYVAKNILGTEGAVVFEGSQGVLLDRVRGFHPFTTKVRTVPASALEILEECGYRGEVKSLGVLRAYHTRHGAGPFVAESDALTRALPDVSNKTHLWQGNFRVGVFDAVAARYAVAAAGALDGLVLTCLDRVQPLSWWPVCHAYTLSGETATSDVPVKLKEHKVVDIYPSILKEEGNQLEQQERITNLLARCVPQTTEYEIPSSVESFVSSCVSTVEAALGLPIVAVSLGEAQKDKQQIKNGR